MNILFLFLPSSLAFLSHLLPLSLLPPRSPSFLSILSFHFWSSSSSSPFFLHNSLPLPSSFDLVTPLYSPPQSSCLLPLLQPLPPLHPPPHSLMPFKSSSCHSSSSSFSSFCLSINLFILLFILGIL